MIFALVFPTKLSRPYHSKSSTHSDFFRFRENFVRISCVKHIIFLLMAIPFFSTFSYSYSIFRKRSCRNDLFYYTMIAPMIEAGQPKKGVWYAFLLEQNRWLVLTVVLPAKTKLNKVQGFHDWIGNDRRKTRHKNMSPDNTRKATPISAFLFLRVLVGYHWL